ncbi:MAG: DsbA family protein [Candidatus Midichloria sp.]|nr:DsbA family protein [Candidatus Midichloria sp.]
MNFIQIIIYCALLFFTPILSSAAATKNEKAEVLKINSNDKFLGNQNAKIVLIEYSSLACPHCADFHISTLPKIKENYIDKGILVYVHRNFPTNKPSLVAAMLASCSNNYFPFLHGLFLSQESWGYSTNFEKSLCNIAKLSGMEKSDFDKCLQNKELKDSIYSEAFKASKILEINATPVFFLNGERIEGAIAYDSLATKIDSRIKLYNNISDK